MRRTVLAAAMVALVSARLAPAKEWAKAMFNATSHDFGVVARGSKVEYRFLINNIYLEDVHIASVTSTCGCTVPQLTKTTLKTYETAELVAALDTLRFSGPKEATLKVVFDKPFPAEVQLHVYCYIRSDVVFEPGEVRFGSVPQGQAVTRRVAVSYAGRRDWQVLAVVSPAPYLSAQVTELGRIGQTPQARVDYELVVRLGEDAPPGYFKDMLVLKTNDPNPRAAQVPISVEGHVTPALSVSPGSLVFVVRSGQPHVRTLVVRGSTPFRILRITGPDERFQFTVPGDARTVHIVPMRFVPTGTPGHVRGKIRVETDVAGAAPVEIQVNGEVIGGSP